jgi:hypothetical protein
MEGYKFATLVVTAANAPAARALSEGLSAAGAGMFTAALCKKGSKTISHYCSTGYFAEEYIDALVSADALYEKALEKEASVTKTLCTKLIKESDISDENPFSVFDRLNLQLYSEEK